MSVVDATRHTPQSLGTSLVEGMREILAFERGEQAETRVGRAYEMPRRLVRRQRRRRRHSLYLAEPLIRVHRDS